MTENREIDTEVDLETIFVVFEDEEGKEEEVECGVLGIFDVGDIEYVALVVPEDESGDLEDIVYIYRYEELDKDEVSLSNIETDEEYDKVVEKFEELYEL